MSTRTMETNAARPAAVRRSAPRRPARSALVEVANPWTGRQTPCSATEESAFVEELEVLSGDADVERFERRDVTVLMTALRCGLTPHDLLAQAPGVAPSRLLAAYHELESRRLVAEHAWTMLTLDPSLLALEAFGARAGELLPAVISQLASCRHDEHRLRAAIEDAAEQVTRTGRRVLMLEQRVAESVHDPAVARELGTLLYDVYGQGAWNLPTYLPPRVGTLVPLRLGALLGDDVTADRRAG